MPTPLAPSAPTPEIPNKLYFRIGDVSKLVGVKPFVLRFWESEFPQLAPKKSGTGHRLYRRKDVETILEIKRLLYDERFTIEGARNHLNMKAHSAGSRPGKAAARSKSAPTPVQPDLFTGPATAATLEAIRRELQEIVSLLS
ncbi:MAG: MerR family transcriptional regulator [Bryobacteraceae bacterium]|nr:MerR family transcriptional regulator [Bryobacteraceae bacterium]MDW8379573.1 MerR family transcriptional regulator [Bryobacterales bacterium]